jgi:hypothetical protein
MHMNLNEEKQIYKQIYEFVCIYVNYMSSCAPCHAAAHCRTAGQLNTTAHTAGQPHIAAGHCHTLPRTLLHTATCTAAHSRAHYRTRPHCRTLPHCRKAAHCHVHCLPQPHTLPHTPALLDSRTLHELKCRTPHTVHCRTQAYTVTLDTCT